jgi:predicted FMN-binding regulatory protein PaiB
MNCDNVNIVLEIVLGVLFVISELIPFCSSNHKGILHTITINVNDMYTNIKVKQNKAQSNPKTVEDLKDLKVREESI